MVAPQVPGDPGGPEVRALLLELRGEPLEDAPLEQLIGHLVEAAGGRASTAAHLTVRGSARLPADVHVAAYRITQEALNNVVRHSRAANAWVTLELEPSHLRLTIEDDGRGFDPDAPTSTNLGLRSMRERAAEVGARLDLVTRVDGGTLVRIDWHKGRAAT